VLVNLKEKKGRIVKKGKGVVMRDIECACDCIFWMYLFSCNNGHTIRHRGRQGNCIDNSCWSRDSQMVYFYGISKMKGKKSEGGKRIKMKYLLSPARGIKIAFPLPSCSVAIAPATSLTFPFTSLVIIYFCQRESDEGQRGN
jgi:hypothetical protein